MAGFIKEVYNEGKLEGKLEGRLEGKLEGRTETIVKLLTIKFKDVPTVYIQKINQVPTPVLEEIENHLFELDKIEDLEKYLIH